MDRPISDDEMGRFNRCLQWIEDQIGAHPRIVGASEMAIGALCVTAGVKSGFVQMGVDLVAHSIGIPNPGAKAGGLIGASLGVLAGYIGKIGVVGGFGGIAIPAWLLAAGGSLVVGELGKHIGSAWYALQHQFNPLQFATGGSLFMLGLYLIKDGARRILGDLKGRNLGEPVPWLDLPKLGACKIMRSAEEVDRFIGGPEALGAAIGGISGFALGGGVAASTFTVLGSHALGSALVAVGLASPPLWPVVALGVGGAVIGGLAGRKLRTRFFSV